MTTETTEMELHRVQIFTWTPRSGVERKWSVDAALDLIETFRLKPNHAITLQEAEEGLRRNYFSGELEPRHIAKADLNIPIIFITLWDDYEKGYRNIVIDGWHRLKKMVLLGRTEPIQAYILGPEQSKAVEIREFIAADGQVWKAAMG
jgi:hypothetical protein